MLRGSCLCSGVTFEIDGQIENIVNCHCRQCRKAQGSAFGTNGFVKATEFSIKSGDDLIKSYESSPGKRRFFCTTCGSPLFSRRDNLPDKIRVRLAILDGEIIEKPTAHIFAASKAEWYNIEDDLPQYETFEPSRA